MDLASRTQFLGSASMDDFYTLLSFSRRAAVFAMRDRRSELILDGLTAIAMIERSRIDFRDALGAMSLLHHAAGMIGGAADELFRKAAALAEPKMSELILGFLSRSSDYQDIRKSWGYTVIETQTGPGFVGWGFKSYQPAYPLDEVALALAQAVKRDKYGHVSVTLASDLPAVWLSSSDNTALNSALASVRGVVLIRADLTPQESPDYKHQALMIFLVELDDDRAAQSLLRLCEEKQTRPHDFAIVGVKHGRLFCLAVGRSFTVGIASFENQVSMQRFSKVIAEVLGNYHR